MKIVFLDRATISPKTVLGPVNFEHTLVTYERTSAQEVSERIADADIVIVNKTKIGENVLAMAKRLRLVAVAATGTDNVDLVACAARGIMVTNVRNYAVHTVPEHTFALMFALRRSIAAYRDSIRAGRWHEAGQFCFFDYPIRDLAGSVLGVIGDGVLGQAVAAMGSALGMKVMYAGHKGREGMGALYTPFEDVLQRADILTLHCPLIATTRHMIGRPEFAKMVRRPLLINTARGGLVDEEALVEALRAGQISGAAFDVVSVEPLPEDHPFQSLLGRSDFILTPHIAWASDEAMQSLADQLMKNIEAFANGAPVNVVRPSL